MTAIDGPLTSNNDHQDYAVGDIVESPWHPIAASTGRAS